MKWRSLLTLVALFYAYGYPIFDGYRPLVLNEPLHEFHAELGSMAHHYSARAIHPLLPYFEKAYAQVSPWVTRSRMSVQGVPPG
jgi:hypothetical protein